MFPYYERQSEQKIKLNTRKLSMRGKNRNKIFINNKSTWKFGVITQKLGHLVKLDE